MTKKPQIPASEHLTSADPMPAKGGSYVRAMNGSLIPAEIPAEPPPETEMSDVPDDNPDLTVNSQPVKEA